MGFIFKGKAGAAISHFAKTKLKSDWPIPHVSWQKYVNWN
jgi:hypothetical protein